MKNELLALFTIISLILTLTGCNGKDPELNYDKFADEYIGEEGNYYEEFDKIYNLKSNLINDDSKNFYHLFLSMQDLITRYDKIYKERENQPSYGMRYYDSMAVSPVHEDLEFLQRLYDKNPEEYYFCEPILNVYAYVGKKYLSENDIREIKEAILYAIDYYYE